MKRITKFSYTQIWTVGRESNPLTMVLQTNPRPTRILPALLTYRFRLMYHHILSYLLVPHLGVEPSVPRLKVSCHTAWLMEVMVEYGGFEPQSVPVLKTCLSDVELGRPR